MIRLDRLSVAKLEVMRHDNDPAPGAVILVTGGGVYRSPLQYIVDRVGRLQFVLPKGDIRIGAFQRGGGVATMQVGKMKPVVPLGQPIRLKLSRPVKVRGIVVDPRGKSIAGARVRPWNRPKDAGYALQSLAFDSYKWETCDASGEFTLILPFRGFTFALRAWIRVKGSVMISKIVEVETKSHVIDGIRLVIDTKAKARQP